MKRERSNLLPRFCTLPLDREYLALVLALTLVGLIMLLSASYPTAYYNMGDAYFYIKKQAKFACFGIVAMIGISYLDYTWLKKVSKPLFIISLMLLTAVLIPGIGVVRNNARRWISVAGMDFQPSEIVKMTLIMAFSASISQKKTKMQTFRDGILPYALVLSLIFALMWKEPHLSGAIQMVAIGCVLMFVGGIKLRWVLGTLGVGGIGALLLLTGAVSYGQSRIAMWHDPFLDPSNEGYQLSQSLLAIGSGGLFGLGLGNSRQKLLYLPEVQNDFIFSIVAEELGLIGASLILCAFALLIIKGFVIACKAKDRFGLLLCVGVTAQFAIQTFLNVAVVTGLLPTTGVSLPFFSYGGTALVIQLAEMGMVLSVSRQQRGEEVNRPKQKKHTYYQEGGELPTLNKCENWENPFDTKQMMFCEKKEQETIVDRHIR